MEPLSLQQISLIKISITLWMRNDVKPFMVKQSNGLVTLEKALPLLQKKVFGFPVTHHLKYRLMNFVQRTGYELYVFLSKFIIKDILDRLKVQWTLKGDINEMKTLRVYLEETKNYSMSEFKMASTVFDELSVRRIWCHLTESEKIKYRTSFRNALFTSYWIYKMEDCLLDFPQDCGSLIIGFDRNNDLNTNMLWHSITINNTNAVYYFYSRLTGNELLSHKNLELDLLKYIIQSGRGEGFKFILSFLEKPVINEQIEQLIINTCDCDYLKSFLEFVLRHVNIFGDLHFNIFCYLLLHTSRKRATTVEENLDFYALTLISKGIFEKFDFISEFDVKNVLYRRIYDRLSKRYGLAIFATIHFNRYTDLLRSFFNWLAITDEDRNFFKESVIAIINGTQYDIQN